MNHHSVLFESLFPRKRDVPIETVDDLEEFGSLKLAYDGDPGGNPGYLFRGELDHPSPLKTSLERRLSKGTGDVSADDLKQGEKSLVERFFKSDASSILKQLNVEALPGDEVFWWLSLMQHYSHPTRFLDLTRDIRIALFFAIEHFEKAATAGRQPAGEGLAVYCLPCRDPRFPHDSESNKSPFDPLPNDTTVDMNLAMGLKIDLEWMERHRGHRKTLPANVRSWGWDRPRYQNPRLRFQKGMFAYPFDDPGSVPLTSPGDSWLAWIPTLVSALNTTPVSAEG